MANKIIDLLLFQEGKASRVEYNFLTSIQSQVTAKETNIIAGLASHLISLVADEKLKEALLVNISTTEAKVPFIQELLEHSFDFAKNETNPVRICKSVLLFNSSPDAGSAGELVADFNGTAGQLLPSARLHCRKQPEGICFEFELLLK